MFTRLIVAALFANALLMWSVSPSRAASLPQPPDVPSSLSGPKRATLELQQQNLEKRRRALAAEIDANNAKCDPEHDETTEAGCIWERGQLRANYGKYMADLRVYLESRVMSLREQTKGYAHAMNQLALNKRAEDIEGWADLASEAQKQYIEQTREALMDTALAFAKHAIQGQLRARYGSFGPPWANARITQLRSIGIEDPTLFDAIRDIAAHPGKPLEAQKINYLIDAVEAYWKSYRSQHASARDEQGEALIRVLSIGLSAAPQLEALAAESRWTISALYRSGAQNLSAGEIDRLTSLTEAQLGRLKDLTTKMEATGKDLRQAKQDLATFTAK